MLVKDTPELLRLIDAHGDDENGRLSDPELNVRLDHYRDLSAVAVQCPHCHGDAFYCAMHPACAAVEIGTERTWSPRDHRHILASQDEGHPAQGFTPAAAQARAAGLEADPGRSARSVTRWTVPCRSCGRQITAINSTLLLRFVAVASHARPRIRLA